MRPIEQIAASVRTALEANTEEHSCILAANVLLDVLKHDGWGNAYPLSVKVMIFNELATKKVQATGLPNGQELIEKWADEGCRFVCLGHGNQPPSPGLWSGHLVVIVPGMFDSKHCMIDLTVSQANKPEWKINVSPIILKISERFTAGEQDAALSKHGCLILYKARLDDTSYESTTNWQDNNYKQQIAAHSLRLLETM